MFEVFAALAVLATLMAAWLPTQHAAQRLQRESQRRQIALFEAAGALERLTAWPAADLTPERTADIALTTAGRNALPEGQMRVDLQPVDDGGLRGLRVAVRVIWRESSDVQQPRQVELVTWQYAVDDGVEPDGEAVTVQRGLSQFSRHEGTFAQWVNGSGRKNGTVPFACNGGDSLRHRPLNAYENPS